MNEELLINNLNLFLIAKDFQILSKKIIILNNFEVECFELKSESKKIKCELFFSHIENFYKLIIQSRNLEYRESFSNGSFLDLFLSYYEKNEINEIVLEFLIDRYQELIKNNQLEASKRIKKIILKQDSSKTYLFNLL